MTMDATALDTEVFRFEPALTAVESTPSPEEPTAAVFEPWALLGTQWTGALMPRASGEKRLMAAVLADAMRLYLKYSRSLTVGGRREFRETAEWVESTSRGALYGFQSICETLGIDAERLRVRLRVLAASSDQPTIPFDAGRIRIGRRRKVRV
jgi:hypothetical protein